MIEVGKTRWTGLLATQSIRGGANRESLARIKQTGDIFFAVSDRDWILDGANVHISMVAFGNGTEAGRTLDGQQVSKINANLTATADISQAKRLPANLNLSFMGDTKGGPFDIPSEEAWKLLLAPNVSGKPSSDVVLPWCNGLDVTRRNRDMWIIDFGIGKPKREAALYDSVFQFLSARGESAERITEQDKGLVAARTPTGRHAGRARRARPLHCDSDRRKVPVVRLDDQPRVARPSAHRHLPSRRLLPRRATLTAS